MAAAAYSWGQSKSWVDVYISGVGAVEAADVDAEFTATSVRVDVRTADGLKRFGVPELHAAIVPDRCSATARPAKGQVLVKMAKAATEADDWPAVDSSVRIKRARHAALAEGGATTQELLANMYADADEEQRTKLREAAAEGARKREADAKKAGLIP